MKTLLMLILMVSLFACAHQEKAPVVRAHLDTDIRPNNLKLFNFTLIEQHQREARKRSNRGAEGRGQGRREGGRGGQRGGQNNAVATSQSSNEEEAVSDAFIKKVYERLEETLASTGYCRNGYFELKQYFSKSYSLIRGECEESATKEDRQRFAQKDRERSHSRPPTIQ